MQRKRLTWGADRMPTLTAIIGFGMPSMTAIGLLALAGFQNSDIWYVLSSLGIAQCYSSILARGPMAGALMGCPSIPNIEPWHGQSQHVWKVSAGGSQHGCSLPSAGAGLPLRRDTPQSSTVPVARSRLRRASDRPVNSAHPVRHTRRSSSSAVTFSVKKFFAAFSGMRPGA